MIPILSYPCTSFLTHLNTSEEGILMTNQRPDVFGPESFNNNPTLKSYVTTLISYSYLTFVVKLPTGMLLEIHGKFLTYVFPKYFIPIIFVISD